MATSSLSKVEREVEQNVLNLRVELSDGTKGYIFSRNPHRNEAKMFTYNCHICSVPNLPGERCLYTHISGRRHQTKLTSKQFDANLFRATLQRSNKIVMKIAPGEPVPPGFENEVKAVAEIQSKIDKCRNVPFIGLEYLAELGVRDKQEPSYLCVLCEKRGDPRTILDHLTSYKHRLKYLEKHFPTVTREISVYRYSREARDVFPHIVQKICEAIEEAYGRLTPTVYDNDEYEKNRMACLQEIINDKHFSEKNGSSFIHVINPKEIEEWIAKSKAKITSSNKRNASPIEFDEMKRGRSSNERRRSLGSISSISSSSLDRSPISHGYEQRKRLSNDKEDDVIYVGSKSRSRSPRDRAHVTKSPGRQTIPTPRELSMQANAISAEGYKWEKYRCLVESAMKDLEKQRLEYEKSPENHPLYPDEWKVFWNRRYKELQAEKKDPTKYDFTPEWKTFWTKRMCELHDESVEKKKDEIRKSLNLPKDGRERTSELKEKYSIKPNSRKESLDPVDSSSSSSARREKVEKTRRYERSRSREMVSKSNDKYKRSSYEREKSYERIERERHEIDRRDRDRDRERHRQPNSRGSYHDESPPRYIREEREPSAVYYSHNSYKWHPGQPKPSYYSKSHYYSREMPTSSLPKYEEQVEDETECDDPLTVVTVLRLLSALEELLGPSLGPKIVELLAKALALEKVKANSADDMLLNEENCVLLETIKEKLKGQLMNDMVEKHRMKGVKRAIKNIAGVIHMASEKEKNKSPEERQQDALMRESSAVDKPQPVLTESKSVTKTAEEEKHEMAKKITAALIAQGKADVSKEELETLVNYYYEQRKAKESASQTQKDAQNTPSTSQPTASSNNNAASSAQAIDLTDDGCEIKKDHDEEFDLPQDASNALESLTDADLQTLLQNFEDLSTEEQQHLQTYMRKLEASDPARVEKLRQYVNVAFDLQKSELNERSDKRNSSERSAHMERNAESRTCQNSDPYNDMFYDDTNKKNDAKVTNIVDSDDDDYSYDDLCKAASKNVKENQRELENRLRSPEVISDSDSVNKHDQFILDGERSIHYEDSNLSRASGENSSSRTVITDTESIIANLMGSLHRNAQNRSSNHENQQQRQQIQSNVPFYLQPQSQAPYAMSNSKSSNQGYANDFNLGGQNQQFSSSNQFRNAYGSQNQNYGNTQRLNIPLNIPTYQQQPQQVQSPQLTNQQAALLTQLSQQQNRRPAW
ncbi:uncharacterized protein CG7065-like [Sitodiplosis mosellana]|uniref:uncharacterized protein CG7065-like n=1 Tax=Sitodiplosis mosellana TaxID=263140 RepID=UPI00244481E9|nr:uncharacterized protein CG7065-like [Sitodiplosis mosellana]XP_055315041.1 uncharacterized protein CG7065-like [Sitodiplosis mosellana]